MGGQEERERESEGGAGMTDGSLGSCEQEDREGGAERGAQRGTEPVIDRRCLTRAEELGRKGTHLWRNNRDLHSDDPP